MTHHLSREKRDWHPPQPKPFYDVIILIATTFQVAVEIDEVSPEPLFLQTKQPSVASPKSCFPVPIQLQFL